MVAVAVMTPPTGWFGARFGARRFLLVTVFGFTAMSLLSGLSESLVEIVVFRTLQGAFGAALVPLSQAVLLDIYPRERHGVAMGWWTMGMMFGPVFGPTLGGYVTDIYSWRWVFFVNLPVGAVAFLLIFAFVPEMKKASVRPFDAFGFVVLAVAIAMLQFMLDRGERLDWFASPQILLAGGLSVSAFYVFAVHTATAREPLIDPAMLRNRNYVIGLALIFLLGVLMLTMLALVPPYLQNLIDYPVTTAGLAMAPRGVGTMIASFLCGRLLLPRLRVSA